MSHKHKTKQSDADIASQDETANEIAKASRVPESAKGAKSNSVWVGRAVGVGSAALVAALLYASRRTKRK